MPTKRRISKHQNKMHSIITADITYLNVEALANKAGISKKNLLIFCKKHYGRTPKQIIDEYRLFRCLVIFVHTRMPVMDAAIATGYNTPEALTRAVRNCYGISPAELQRQIRVMTEEEKEQLVSEIYCKVALFKNIPAIIN